VVEKVGGQALDLTGLSVEKNYQRYRKPITPIIVRIDDSTSNEDITLIKHIAQVTKTEILWSTATAESITDLVARATYKIRWLSGEKAPRKELLAKGVSLDNRPVAQRGDIEAPRWLLEQSVAITHHRYGNVNGGPKPACKGLASY